jgi:hypothetical protein
VRFPSKKFGWMTLAFAGGTPTFHMHPAIKEDHTPFVISHARNQPCSISSYSTLWVVDLGSGEKAGLAGCGLQVQERRMLNKASPREGGAAGSTTVLSYTLSSLFVFEARPTYTFVFLSFALQCCFSEPGLNRIQQEEVCWTRVSYRIVG